MALGRGALVMVVLLLVAAPASRAGHDTDMHSDNMSLVASLDTGHGGELAFWGDIAVLAHGTGDGISDSDIMNDGFKIIDISEPRRPREIGSFTCHGAASDIGIWGDLVFLSAEYPFKLGSGDCLAPPVAFGEPNWMGIRIVSIEDPARPVQVGAVGGPYEEGFQSHNHTVVPDLDHRNAAGKRDPRVLIYNSSSQAGGRMSIIEVPLRDPGRARVIHRFLTPNAWACHDISFFVPRGLAVCNAVTATVLYDVTDLERPKLISTIANPFINHNHSSAFSWDGDTLVIVDENFSSFFANRCAAGSEEPIGALWFYDVSNPALPVPLSHYQLPQRVPPGTICTAHQFNVVPLEGDRDVLVAGWYTGGMTVVDFTDPGDPQQIGYYVSEPEDPERRSVVYSAYFYNGYIYANNAHAVLPGFSLTTERGFDVLSIDHPALEGARRQRSFNFGLQDPSLLHRDAEAGRG